MKELSIYLLERSEKFRFTYYTFFNMNVKLATRLLLLVALSLLMLNTEVAAQNIFVTKEKVIQELEARGLEYFEVEQRLNEEGIDLNFLDQSNITPEQIQIIRNVILELEVKKQEEFVITSELDSVDLEEELVSDSLELDTIFEEDLDEEEEFVELIYGQNLLRSEALQLQSTSEEIKAPDSYVLGPGDELVVSAWGRSQFVNEFKISDDGYVIIDDKHRVFLKGLNLGVAREKLFKYFLSFYTYRRGEFDVALNFSRTVRISIYGDVAANQGSYAISAFNSAFNALSIVDGTNDIGSLRNIQLRKASGEIKILDVYAFMKNPTIANDYFLDDNDVIIVPVAEKIITIEGAIRRPHKYELIDKEGIKELLDFAGGFAENAFQKKIQVQRYEDDSKKIIDIDWRSYQNSGKNFELRHGDVIIIESVDEEFSNFVEILGEVSQPGIFERNEGMKVANLIRKAGITSLSDVEVAYLTRDNNNGTFSYEKLNIANILRNPNSPDNLILKNKDKLEIWAKDRFTDDIDIAIDGAVRFPGKFPFDDSQTLKVRDAIMLAGGLRRDASNFAIIHRNDPVNPKVKEYKTINDLQSIFDNENDELNFVMSPFDSLVIMSKNIFLEESYVRIEGAVNTPGEYQYGIDMNIKDLMTLAGGFKLSASTNNIEISRVVIRNNESTKTVVANLEMDRDFNVLNGDKDYRLEPYDNIAVRYIKDHELQRRVFMDGEVAFPGPYAISKENEKISSIIARAGGLTDEAFPAGATLERTDNDYDGFIVIKLEEILTNPASEFNFLVKNGDKITVPRVKEFVTIQGATRAYEAVGQNTVNEGNEIHVPYHKNKDALFYINEYAGGLHELADRQKIFVEHANGEIKRLSTGFLIKRYPKVYQGSKITVGFKSFDKKEEDKKEEINWTKVLGDSVTQAMSILTLLLVISRLE